MQIFRSRFGQVISWVVLGILCFVFVLNFLDRQLLSILAKPIQDSLQISDGQLGYVTGFYFALFYCFIAIPVGWLADRTNRVNVLALACDIVIAAESAQFALPEIKLAMLPGAGGTQRLPRAIGKAKAMDMCLSARMLNAEEADRYGLVSRVVPDAELQTVTLKLATQIAGYSLPALMAIKESVNRAHEASLSEGILFERRALHARFASDDAHEGMHAFLDKRKPVFQHR